MSGFPTWEGEKDRGMFRSMSDSIGGTDGVRTVIRDDGESRVMLRTRGGNPDVKTTSTNGGVKEVFRKQIFEVDYSERKYWRDKSESSAAPVDFEMKSVSFHNDKNISRYSFFLRRFKLSIGYAKIKEPDTSIEVEPGAIGESTHWMKYRYSSDGIIGIPQLSPKKMTAGEDIIRLKSIERYPATASMADLLVPGDGNAGRTFYDYVVIRGAMFPWLYAVVKPVRSVDCTISERKSAITFDEPYLEPGDTFHGVNQMPLNPMDHVRVFGQPWHGRQDLSGVLTLAGGETKAGHQPGHFFAPSSTYRPIRTKPTGYGRFLRCGLVDFSMPSVPTPGDAETEAGLDSGAAFKTYAYLNGPYSQMSPVDESNYRVSSSLPPGSWLYKCSDGAVWCLFPSAVKGASPGVSHALRIRGFNLNRKLSSSIINDDYSKFSWPAGDIVFETSSAAVDIHPTFWEEGEIDVSFSKDGSKAHIPAECSYSYTLVSGNLGGATSSSTQTANGTASFFLSVTGGGLDSPPLISIEYVDGSPSSLGVFGTNWNYSNSWHPGSAASYQTSAFDNRTTYLGGFVKSDGSPVKVTLVEKAVLTHSTVWVGGFSDWVEVPGGLGNGVFNRKVKANSTDLYSETTSRAVSWHLYTDGAMHYKIIVESFSSNISNRIDHTSGFLASAKGFVGLFSTRTTNSTSVDGHTLVGAVSGTTKPYVWALENNQAMSDAMATALVDTDYISFDQRTSEFLINKWPW